MSGRGASYPAPPPQIPPCGFPAVGSRRRSNAIEGGSFAAHVPPTRRLAASVTRRPGSESGACVAARLSFDRPPSLHSLRCRFVVGFVRGFIGTTQPSDSSRLPQQLRLLDFLSWPGIALATAGGVRSPRFRRDPFIRDVASDPGRATVPRVTAPHMLPSAIATASAPATSRISWLNPTPQMITVYASPWSSPSPTQHSLPGGRYPLPGPDFHRLDRARIDVRLCFGDRPRLGFLVYVKNGFGRGHENSPCALCIITHQLTGKLMLLPAGASVLASIRRTWFDASDPRARPVVRRMRFGIEIAGVEAPDVGQESF